MSAQRSDQKSPEMGCYQPTVLVIFGASGDLTHRKLIPAISNLVHDGYLNCEFYVIGASRTKYSDEEFRDILEKSVAEFAPRVLEGGAWEQFREKIFYQPLDGTKPEDFHTLSERMNGFVKSDRGRCTYLYYLSTDSRFFVPIAENLKNAGLISTDPKNPWETRLVVEKPFGHDLESAIEFNNELRAHLREDQIFRIDHYLGKETVQNILVMRFCNKVFEPLWNSKYVDQIQISVCESIGVGRRAAYFDKTGIVRDIVQNHVMQMLSLLCIEPPTSFQHPDDIRDEKVKVLKACRRISSDMVHDVSVRAQYTSGEVEGESVSGYLEEEGVDSDSNAETFVAMQLEINNWRWAGVPIFIRAGKRLPKRITEISVFFKDVPAPYSNLAAGLKCEPNVLSIQVQPQEGISLSLNSKLPGPGMNVRTVDLDFTYDHSFSERSPEAYERLLLDAIKGDSTLFTRDDEIEQAWDVLSPFFHVWDKGDDKMAQYSAGTPGPKEAEDLLSKTRRQWRVF